MPATQIAQVDEPVFPWYFPATQSVQPIAPATEYLPSGQLAQLEGEDDPEVETYFPRIQFEHMVEPVLAW